MKAITRRKTRLCRQIAFPLCGKQGKMNADIQAQTVADIGIIFGIKRKLVPVQIAVRGIVVDGILCRLPVYSFFHTRGRHLRSEGMIQIRNTELDMMVRNGHIIEVRMKTPIVYTGTVIGIIDIRFTSIGYRITVFIRLDDIFPVSVRHTHLVMIVGYGRIAE